LLPERARTVSQPAERQKDSCSLLAGLTELVFESLAAVQAAERVFSVATRAAVPVGASPADSDCLPELRAENLCGVVERFAKRPT